MKLSHMWILSAFLVCAFGSAARAQTAVVRVDGDVDEADPSGQGGAWGEDNAYKFLQDALSQAELLLGNPEIEEVQIWVKATARDNPYLPDRDMVDEEGSCEGDPVVICDQESSFELRSSVHVYGGFDGTETEADERSPIANETFLSGDLDGGDAGFPSLGLDNAHHVVLAEAVDSSARIDGFTITLGQADGAELGGGMLITDADPVVLRCNFEANYARFGGGGAHVDGAASEAYFSN